MTSSASPSSIKASLPDYFLLALLLFILATITQLLLPFSGALLLSAVVGIVFYPFYQGMSRHFPKRSPSAHAFMADVLVLLFFIVPLVLLVWVIVNEAQALSPTLKQWKTTLLNFRDGGADALAPLRSARQWLSTNVGIEPDQVSDKIGNAADNLINFISLSGAAIAKNSVGVVLDLFVIVFTLFFIFRDGVKMVTAFKRYIPLRAELKDELEDRVRGTISGVMRGMFLTSLVQGLTAAIGYFIAGVPAVAVFGFLTALASLIPSIGTTLVWLPLSIFYLLKHAYFKSFFLLAWGLLVVGLLDNFLRPYFMSGKSELPFLALFFALLGGIQIWGFKGILIGPLVMSILPILLEAYRRRYLSPTESQPAK